MDKAGGTMDRDAYTIRKLGQADLAAALELVWSVFSAFEAPDYSEQGVASFRAFLDEPALRRRVESGDMSFWGCYSVDGEMLLGTLAVRDVSHICLLFVAGAHHREGIGRRLFEAALADCREQDSDIRQFTVHSSPCAADFYRHLGFVDTDVEQCSDGIRFIPMRLVLSPRPGCPLC